MKRFAALALCLAILAIAPVATFAQDGDSTDLETYTVRAGDNLYRIAIRFDTTVSAIAAENGITDFTRVFVGQQLRIPGTTAAPSTPDATATEEAGGTGGPTNQETGTYTVVRGDTLNNIARRFGTTFTAIAQANNLANPNLIFPGQVLTIPGTTPGETTGTSAPADPPADTPTDGGSGSTGGQYTVVPGDTLNAIARRFGTSTTAIAQANGITNPNLIFVGQVLNVPGAGTSTPVVDSGDATTGGTTTGGDTSSGTTTGSTAPPQPSNVAGGFELGGQAITFAYPDLMRGTGMSWVKIQWTYRLGEPALVVEDVIRNAHNRGFKLLLSIKGDPGELAANPDEYYREYASFVGSVAELAPDGRSVEGIQIWNEMNIDREWPSGLISGANYTNMLRQSYQNIKAKNSSVLVVSGSPAPTGFFQSCTTAGCNDNAFIRDMANAGASQFLDCVGLHYNEGVVPPTANSGDPRGNSTYYTRYYNGMVSLYSSTFPGKPLCFTEIGYLSPEGYGPLPPGFEWAANTTVAQQAEYLAGAATLARNSGRVRLFIVWNVDATQYSPDPQAGYAIVRPDQTCPACNALRDALQ
ncbi:MAG: LysM peptidoglycan-binding domain-containing protein [Chloroflexota bacterium]